MRILVYLKITPILFRRPGKQQYELKLANLADKLQKQLEDILNEKVRRNKDIDTFNIADEDYS